MCEVDERDDSAGNAAAGRQGLQYIGMAVDGDSSMYTYVYEIDPITQEFVLKSIYVDVESEPD